MMSRLSKVLRQAAGNRLAYWCPGCDEAHALRVRSGQPITHPSWSFDGDIDAPTFAPPVLITIGPDIEDNIPQRICHSFVRAGRIQFLADCTHTLVGQTVDMVEFEE